MYRITPDAFAVWNRRIPQFIRFLVIGSLNSFLGLGVIWFNVAVLALHPILANGLAYLVMFPISLWSFARGVFAFDGALRRAILAFVGVFVTATLSNLICVGMILRRFPEAGMLAQVAGMMTYVAVHYSLSRVAFARMKRSVSDSHGLGAAREHPSACEHVGRRVPGNERQPPSRNLSSL